MSVEARPAWKFAYEIKVPTSWVDERSLTSAVLEAVFERGHIPDGDYEGDLVLLIVEVLPLVSPEVK